MLNFLVNFFKGNSYTLLNPIEETININGVEWATTNAGTDKFNSLGKLYTIEEALDLEDDNWRLPTREEVLQLQLLNRSALKKRKYRGTIINTDNGNLFFPWNYRPTRFDGKLLIGGYWTGSYELCPYFSSEKYYFLFEIGKTVFKLYGGGYSAVGCETECEIGKTINYDRCNYWRHYWLSV